MAASCTAWGSGAEYQGEDVGRCEKGFSPHSQAGSFSTLPQARVKLFLH